MYTSASRNAVIHSPSLVLTWTKVHGLFSCHKYKCMSSNNVTSVWSSALLSAQQSSHVCPHDWIRGRSSWTFTSRRTTLWICQTELSQCLSTSEIISATIFSFTHLLLFNPTHGPPIVRREQSQILCAKVYRMSNTEKKRADTDSHSNLLSCPNL